MKELCNKLNNLIPITCESDREEVNNLIIEMYNSVDENVYPKPELYYDRDLMINCNFDSEKIKDMVRYSGLVQFEPSDDSEEHPGIVVRYKEKANQ